MKPKQYSKVIRLPAGKILLKEAIKLGKNTKLVGSIKPTSVVCGPRSFNEAHAMNKLERILINATGFVLSYFISDALGFGSVPLTIGYITGATLAVICMPNAMMSRENRRTEPRQHDQ